jgi:copper chaperone CopZ
MRTSVIVQNLKCGGCVNSIGNKLKTIDNIENIEPKIPVDDGSHPHFGQRIASVEICSSHF